MAASDAFYNEIVADVISIVNEFGTSYIVRKEGSYDPATLTTTEGEERSVIGLVADQNVAYNLSTRVGEQGSSWVSEKSLLLTPDALPLNKEEVKVDGKWFPLGSIQEIKPADVVVLYVLDISL